jgi:hypothetical protein
VIARLGGSMRHRRRGLAIFAPCCRGSARYHSPVSGRLGLGHVHSGRGAAATASGWREGQADRQRYRCPPVASVGPWRGNLTDGVPSSHQPHEGCSNVYQILQASSADRPASRQATSIAPAPTGCLQTYFILPAAPPYADFPDGAQPQPRTSGRRSSAASWRGRGRGCRSAVFLSG